MKGVLFCVLSLIVASCGYHEDAETSFASRDLLPQPPQPAADTAAKSHYYAKYIFTASGKYDVDVALRVGIADDGGVTRIEVKDISPGREDSEIEVLNQFRWTGRPNSRFIFSEGKRKPYGNRTEFGFSAKAAGQGGTYYGWFSHPTNRYSGIRATDDNVWCCGEMHFVDNPRGTEIQYVNPPYDTFVGTEVKLAGLDELWWKEVTGSCEHKLEFGEFPTEMTIGEAYDLRVHILDCIGNHALVFKGQAHISRRFKDHGTFYMSRDEHLYFGKGSVEFTRKINPTLYTLLQDQGYGEVVQYKVSTDVNGQKISAISPKIRILPKEEEN